MNNADNQAFFYIRVPLTKDQVIGLSKVATHWISTPEIEAQRAVERWIRLHDAVKDENREVSQ